MADLQPHSTMQEEMLPLEIAQEKETGRIEAFSDAIFAVAITLLILNIRIPPMPQNQNEQSDFTLALALLHDWPFYLAFLTSFATIGIMWINHHRLFNYIKSSNNMLLILNLLLLLLVVFVPFPTILLTDYRQPQYHLPAELYSATYVLLAICFNILWRYASYKNRLLDKRANSLEVQAISRQYMFGPLLYLIAFGLAFLYVPASIIWNLLLALFFALPGRIVSQPHTQRRTNPDNITDL